MKTSDEQKDSSDVILIPAVVTHVINWDTIEVIVNGQEETVRMILIDSPETKHPRLGIQPFGPEANDFTQHTLTGKKVDLEKTFPNEIGMFVCFNMFGLMESCLIKW